MPEGDTIYRTAERLHAALASHTVERALCPRGEIDASSLVGRRVEFVESKGKNVLIEFDDGRVLHTHLRMRGAWHVYDKGQRWRRHAASARLLLETSHVAAVCFQAPVIRLLSPHRVVRDAALSRLGPDLLDPDFSVEYAMRRLRALNDREIHEALLDQRALAGIGNVFKSEVLYLSQLDPWTRVGDVSDEALRAVVALSQTLLVENKARPRRVTRRALTGGRHWVYRRSGKPCYRCGVTVEMQRRGVALRSTYFCPQCQTPNRCGDRAASV